MIYIVRHGQTDWNTIGRIQGWQDIELNGRGIEQARILREKLKDVEFDEVISSPLKRALRTAKEITGRKYKDIKKDKRIIERCNGEREGKLNTEVDQTVDFNDPNETRYGIENIKDFKERVYSFCRELEKNYKNKNVLVATHAGVSIYIKCYFEGEPKDNDYNKLKLGNCEVIEYENREEI